MVEQAGTEMLENRGRGLVGDQRPPVLEPSANEDGNGGQDRRQHQLADRGAGERAPDQPAQQRQAHDAGGAGEHAERGHGEQAVAHAFGEGPEPGIEIHSGASA